MYTHLCKLIQCAIWQEKPDEWNLDNEEWNKLLQIAKVQAIQGLVIDGMCLLDKDRQPERQKKLECAAMLHIMEQMNLKLNALVERIFQENGEKCPSMVLMKGQSIATRYPNPLHRACGDVDIYCHKKEEMSIINKWAKEIASHIDTFYEAHHIVYRIEGLTVENHLILSELRSKRLREDLRQIVDDEIQMHSTCMPTCIINNIAIPELPTDLYALFLLVHMAEHLIEDGLGMRQVVDWCMFFDKEGEKVDKVRFWAYVKKMNLERLAHAFGEIIVDDLGLKETKLPFTLQRNEHRKQLLINAMMKGGNFGHELYPWKGNVNKIYDMWLTAQVKIPRYAHMYNFWPKEARACYSAMLARGIRRFFQIIKK